MKEKRKRKLWSGYSGDAIIRPQNKYTPSKKTPTSINTGEVYVDGKLVKGKKVYAYVAKAKPKQNTGSAAGTLAPAKAQKKKWVVKWTRKKLTWGRGSAGTGASVGGRNKKVAVFDQPQDKPKLLPANKIPLVVRTKVNITDTSLKDQKVKVVDMKKKPEMIQGPHGQTRVPIEVTTDKKVITRSEVGQIGRDQHSTLCKTGRPTTKAIRLLKTLQGSTTTTLYDTKINLDVTQEREVLDQSHGFNQRLLWMLPFTSFVNFSQILDRARIAEAAETIANAPSAGVILASNYTKKVRLVASLMKTVAQFKVYNQSAHFPIKFKVHLVKAHEAESPESIYAQVAVHAVGTTAEGSVPQGITRFYVHRVNTLDVNSGVSVLLSNKGKGLGDSDYWNKNFEVVKTFYRTLEPHDSWVFTHEHHFGGGLDLNDVLSSIKNTGAGSTDPRFVPSSYFLVVESTGVTTEGVYAKTGGEDGDTETFIGTSPGFYISEWRTMMQFVNADNKVGEAPWNNDFTGTTSLEGDNAMHIRAFIRDEDAIGTESAIPKREFFANPEDLNEEDGLVAGKTQIPVLTDVQRTNRVSISGRASSQNP